MEVMQKISDKPLARHAQCGGKLVKEWSRTGFQFKGEGWYVTDYAGKKTGAQEEAKETKSEAADPKPAADKPPDAAPAKTRKKAPATGND